ncbi:MAG TPA: hypothetical protein P5136_00105 [Methanofastidiosum sp.]|nr:hypothetical protein [Methanofastidiosum sp.]
MNLNIKHIYIIVGIIVTITLIGIICSTNHSKTCTEYSTEFKNCIDRQLIESRLNEKEKCDVVTFSYIVDLCKKGVLGL